MDFLELVKEFVNPAISAVFALLIQIVKVLLSNRKIRFKRQDTWVWVVLALGPIMAILDLSIIGFESSGIGSFIFMALIHSALSAFFYKVVKKIGGRYIARVFKTRR